MDFGARLAGFPIRQTEARALPSRSRGIFGQMKRAVTGAPADVTADGLGLRNASAIARDHERAIGP